MARFEVFIPALEPDGMSLTLRVTADTWMAALKVGLKKIGVAGGMPQNVLCDVQDDESIHVTDPRTSAVFRIVEIPEFSDPGKPMPKSGAAQPDALAQAQQELSRLAAERATQVNADALAARAAAAARAEAEARAAAERASLEKQLVQLQAEAKAAAERAVAAEARATLALQTAAERADGEKRAAEAAAAAESRRAAEAKAASEARDKASRAAQERAAAERASQEKAAAEKAAQERVAAARAAADQAKAERAAAEKAAQEKSAAADKAAQEKLAAEKLRADKLAAARAAIQKSAAARSAAEAKAADTQPDGAKVARTPLAPGAVKVVEAASPRNKPPAQIGRIGEVGDVAAVEDVLIDLFEQAPAVFEKPLSEALYFLLDLALEKIPSESGSLYLADLNRRDLRFGAVRGPKSAELLKLDLRIPMGRGFVGFCAQEGVAVAISDAQRDQRFFGDVSEKLGYETRSMLTTPILTGGRTLGALQLINKTGSSSFTPGELSVLHYISLQAARYLEAHDE